MDKINVLFTSISGPGGVSVINSLKGFPRYRLYGVDGDPFSLGLYSNYLDARYLVPYGDSPDYIEHIKEIVKKHKITILLPMSDEEVTALSFKKKEFENMGVSIPISSNNVITIADDKLSTTRIAKEIGIPVPATIELNDIDTVDFSMITYPALLKPRRERGGKGISIVNNKEELMKNYYSLSKKYKDGLMLQEYVPGNRGSIYLFAGLFDKKGNLKASFMSRSIRTKFDFGGPGEGGEPVIDQVLKEQSLKLLNSIGKWFGPINVEFKRNAVTNELVLLEINPRYWGYSYLATAAGINFPLLTMKVALEEDFQEQHTYRTDIITLKSNEHCVVEKNKLVAPIDF